MLIDGMDQEELKAIAQLRRDLSGAVSLMAVRNNRQRLLALVIAATSQDALEAINEQTGGGWELANTSTIAIQRNVEMDRNGVVLWVPWRAMGGEHTARTIQGRASRARKKKAAKLRREANGE